MKIGFLTVPMRDRSLQDVFRFAESEGFDCLEIYTGRGAGHLDVNKNLRKQASEVSRLLEEHGVEISSLAYYQNVSVADPKERAAIQKDFHRAIDLAAMIDVKVVCCLAGLPLPGKSKSDTLKEVVAPFYRKLCPYAAKKGVKLAMENWFATNIQHLGLWEQIFDLVPNKNFGLNFDPSHLYWQQIDHLKATEQFASRIFHSHGKDCEIRPAERAKVGVLEYGWWRYVIPGYGEINWGAYIGTLRRVGFDGVISIEHEDGTLKPEDGFRKGLHFLRQFTI